MILKTTKVLVLLIIIVTHSFAQDFEGKVTYKNTYKSKIANMTDEQFASMMGTSQEYLFKEGNYKSSTNGTFLQWQLYINKDNKLYNKMSNSSTILWNDGAVNSDEIINSVINKNVIVILGHQCDELVLTCKSGIQKYYFNSKLKVDPKLFENHKFGNWNEVISKSNSIPLKITIDNQQFSIESLATEIQPMKLESSLFELPADSKVEKSPY